MQTFLPEPDFDASLRVLDTRRLGKQRVEGIQILRTLTGATSGWANHPAVRMWREHEWSLLEYTATACAVWVRRGYDNRKCAEHLGDLSRTLRVIRPDADLTPPPWLGDEAVHRSHRSNLIRKDRAFYEPFWPGERDDLPYVWPVS